MDKEARQVQTIDQEKGSDWAGLVCPFPVTNEARLKIFCLFFKPVVVGLPWYLEPPAAYGFEDDSGPVRFIYPSEDLKPEPDFKKQIADFKHWSVQNQGAGPSAYLKDNKSRENSEETSREIEQELRGLKPPVSPESQNRGRPWNLTLHLAHEIDTREAEIDQILKQIRTRPAPLKVLQEAEDAPGFFNDLSPFQSKTLLSEQQTEQVLAAWCGLFGSYLAAYPVLVTDRRPVWDFLSAVGDPSGRPEQAGEATLEFLVPDLSHHSFLSLVELRRAYFKPRHWEAFKKALNAFIERPREAQAELVQAGREIERALPAELKTRQLRIKVKGLTPLTDPARFRGRSWLPALFNKVLIFMDRNG